MKNIRDITLADTSKEELLPGFSADFPYIASRAELDRYTVPWHWHKALELFYMESGTLEYSTPHGKWIFPAGSGGLLNSNVLHCSRVLPGGEANIQLLHLFDPVFLSGSPGSIIENRYILPLLSSGLELLSLYPEQPDHLLVLDNIKQAFTLSEEIWGYEFHLRALLSKIWLDLYALAEPAFQNNRRNASDDQLKQMMIYIHEHYPEPISIDQLANIAHISRRVCFRLFQQNLHMTPLQYIQSYRLQKARELLKSTSQSITTIAATCGLGSNSYFTRIFRKEFDCSPLQFRKQ